MSFSDHFQVNGDAISPQPWMQLRSVGTGDTAAVTKNYNVDDGVAKNEIVQSLQVGWTNNSPIDQYVYGMVTKDGCQVTLQTRTRAYLMTNHGVQINGEALAMVEVSRFGVGADIGLGGLLATGAAFCEREQRCNANTIPLLPAKTGMWLLEPGDSILATVQVWFRSDFWENTSINDGDSDSKSFFIAGDVRLDLFALPAVLPPGPRTIPTLVGGADNVSHDTQLNAVLVGYQTTLTLPTGLANGDVLLAVTANQFGLSTDIYPLESGWTMIHERNEGLFAFGDVHMRIFIREVVDHTAEPAAYHFQNNFPFSEEIAVLIPIRGATPYDDSSGANWYIASNLSTNLFANEEVAPSIERAGQLLLCVSYFNHSPTQAAINQAPPDGMTELVDIPGLASTMAIAYLSSPPFPTFDRHFTPSETPIFFGHSIAASIVIPGLQT